MEPETRNGRLVDARHENWFPVQTRKTKDFGQFGGLIAKWLLVSRCRGMARSACGYNMLCSYGLSQEAYL